MFCAFKDVPPSGDELTQYDEEHTVLYILLLDRRERGRDWRETTRAFFGIDVDCETDRARHVYDSHYARAAYLLQNVPSFAMKKKMAAFF
jgi:hypothetical protein